MTRVRRVYPSLTLLGPGDTNPNMQPLRLEVLIASTRPGRVGWPVGSWFVERARAHGRFDVVLIDLKELALPMLDEPKHPRLGQYEHEHTKRWSETVKAADAFVFVTPEYNTGTPPRSSTRSTTCTRSGRTNRSRSCRTAESRAAHARRR